MSRLVYQTATKMAKENNEVKLYVTKVQSLIDHETYYQIRSSEKISPKMPWIKLPHVGSLFYGRKVKAITVEVSKTIAEILEIGKVWAKENSNEYLIRHGGKGYFDFRMVFGKEYTLEGKHVRVAAELTKDGNEQEIAVRLSALNVLLYEPMDKYDIQIFFNAVKLLPRV